MVMFIIILLIGLLILASKILNWDDLLTLVFVIFLMVIAAVGTDVNKNLHQKINELEQGCPQYEQVEETMWRLVK